MVFPLSEWRRRRDDRWADHERRLEVVWTFREACIGAGLSQAVDAPVAGTSHRAPDVTRVDLGPPLRMTVRMLPGQLPEHLAAVGRRIAPHLGGIALRVSDRGQGWALVDVLDRDPLVVPLPLRPGRGVLIGRGEDGDELRVDPLDLPHMIVQGQTRSGKSMWLYALLVQLLADPRVEVAGVDPSGITLRPFTGTHHAARQAVGLADLDAVEGVLAGLVADLDDRLAAMPADRDILPVGGRWPLRVVVLEEWPALLRALDIADPKGGKRVRALVARLLAESHKVGHRVVIAAQRAEATIVGGAERAQCAGRLSFRVDGLDSIKLLHADADDLAAGHTSAPPGIALATWPGRRLSRVRGPYLGDYSTYAAAIAAAGLDDHGAAA